MPRRPQRTLVLGLNFPPEATGVSPYTGAMVRGLASRDHTVRVLTSHPHYPDWKITPGYGGWSQREQIEGADVLRLLHYVPRRPSPIRRALSEFTFGVRQASVRWGRPDAIIAVSPALIASAFARARSFLTHPRTPFVVWVQDLYGVGAQETGQASGLAERLIRTVESWLLRRATTVVVIHDRFAARVQDDFGVPRDRIVVVRNWTHLPPLQSVDRSHVRARYGWEDDEVVVLHTGNMGVKQGLHHVVEAGRLAQQRGERVRFVLAGNGSQREELQHLAAASPGSVQFIPPLNEKDFADALQSADVLLVNELPGVAEMAVPSKLTSYFAAGRPILAATDHTGITADEVRAAHAGVIVPAGDAEAILTGALAIAAEPGRADALGANGRRYRETVLDETFAIERFGSLLAELAAQSVR